MENKTCNNVGGISEIIICKFPRGISTFEDFEKWIKENPKKYKSFLKRNKVISIKEDSFAEPIPIGKPDNVNINWIKDV